MKSICKTKKNLECHEKKRAKRNDFSGGKKSYVEWFLSKHSAWHIRIFPFSLDRFDFCQSQASASSRLRVKKKLTLTYRFFFASICFFVRSFVFWCLLMVFNNFVLWNFLFPLYFIHSKFEFLNKMRWTFFLLRNFSSKF